FHVTGVQTCALPISHLAAGQRGGVRRPSPTACGGPPSPGRSLRSLGEGDFSMYREYMESTNSTGEENLAPLSQRLQVAFGRGVGVRAATLHPVAQCGS